MHAASVAQHFCELTNAVGQPTFVESRCDRCGRKNDGARFIFYEAERADKKHRFGFFCAECTKELLDELKGKLEWFCVESGWRGYINPEARLELAKAGLISPKRHSQYIEVSQVMRRHRKASRRDALGILRVERAAGLISADEYKRRLKKLREGAR
jgi:hypothetical protein